MSIVEQDVETVLDAQLPWDRLDGATVVVTGASGFIGSFLTRVLMQCSNVVALVRDEERARARLGRSERLQTVVQDLAVPFVYDGPIDFAIHLASHASPRFYGIDPIGTLLPNVLGTFGLLEAARKHGCQGFLFISSGEVYGQVPPENVPTREEQIGFLDPTTIRACYGEGKRCGEAMCVAYAHQYEVPVSIARPFHTYGPGMALDDGRVHADFLRDVLDGQNIKMQSDGSARRAFCYLADAVEGMLTVLLRGERGTAYNVGNPDAETSILELAELLTRLFPERGITVERQTRPTGDYLQSPIARNSPDISRVRALGWSPTTNLANGFRRTVLSYEQPSDG